jgi:hypothetical protein
VSLFFHVEESREYPRLFGKPRSLHFPTVRWRPLGIAGERYSTAGIPALVTVDFAAKAINLQVPEQLAALSVGMSSY